MPAHRCPASHASRLRIWLKLADVVSTDLLIKALAVMSLAGNIPASMSELAKLSDEIWFLAGDQSHDTTWYTKRATLSAVYASTGKENFLPNCLTPNRLFLPPLSDTDLELNLFFLSFSYSYSYNIVELFMTQDNSKDFEATWEFLDRRLNDVKTIGSTVSNIASYLDFTVHAFANVLRSKNVPFF